METVKSIFRVLPVRTEGKEIDIRGLKDKIYRIS